MYYKNKLNRFLTYENLLSILNVGLNFSNKWDNWEDKNDVELLKLYEKIEGKKIKILCLQQDDETIHHWSFFTYNGCKKDVCCIEFDKEKLLELYSDKEKYIHGEVQYETINDVCFDNPKELLLTKRYPYRSEKEYRIIQIGEDIIKKVTDAITKITLSQKLSDEEYCQRKEWLQNNYNLPDNMINKSTICENQRWIAKAKKYADMCEKKSSKIDEVIITGYDIEKFRSLLEKGEQVDMKYFYSSLNKKPILTMTYDKDEVTAIGALKRKRSEYAKKIFGNAQSLLNPQDYDTELGWIVTEEKHRKQGLCNSVVKKLLYYFKEQRVGGKLFATVRKDNDGMMHILEKNGFKKEGEPFDSKRGPYKLCLYVYEPQSD
jgi:ribosomal protein S18 acetylase RimI-like enzyme